MTGILEVVGELRPARLLDVGCGCGRFTRTLTSSCGRIVAIDPIRGLGSCARESPGPLSIDFCRMDACRLAFTDAAFPVVLERASLHHIRDWRRALGEMFRVSSEWVLIEEPLDSDRTPAHRRTAEAHRFFLELQREVGYPHFPHLGVEGLCAAIEQYGVIGRRELTERDEPVAFDDFFAGYSEFAERSGRVEHWQRRRREFESSCGGGELCRQDTIVVGARKANAGGAWRSDPRE